MSVVGIPNDARNAALKAVAGGQQQAHARSEHFGTVGIVDSALAAAVPYIEAEIRAEIANEIEAERLNHAGRRIFLDASYNAVDSGIDDGLCRAARVARGTQETTDGA